MLESAGKDLKIIRSIGLNPHISSDEFKVLGDFVSNYSKSRPTKYRSNHTTNRYKINRKQDNNAIVNSEVDEILL